ncbi:FHIPEP family type III secretion protein, partial [Salmonella enterica subsp. enterica serovar Kentucky]|nr:FHIPEP family type III secretion protein [Salmonella enterica subsp. enterica serovar Kentucky]
MGSAAESYTLLTIGDGLVAQIPALVISTAAGVIVTRVSTDQEQTDTVQNGQITLRPADSHGLLLLERAETHASAPFNWRNATVY